MYPKAQELLEAVQKVGYRNATCASPDPDVLGFVGFDNASDQRFVVECHGDSYRLFYSDLVSDDPLEVTRLREGEVCPPKGDEVYYGLEALLVRLHFLLGPHTCPDCGSPKLRCVRSGGPFNRSLQSWTCPACAESVIDVSAL